MRIATFNINNVNKRLANLLACTSSYPAAIADDPTDGAVERRCCFDDVHELERGQSRPAERCREEEPEQPDGGESFDEIIGEPPAAVELTALFRHDRCELADRSDQRRNDVRTSCLRNSRHP